MHTKTAEEISVPLTMRKFVQLFRHSHVTGRQSSRHCLGGVALASNREANAANPASSVIWLLTKLASLGELCCACIGDPAERHVKASVMAHRAMSILKLLEFMVFLVVIVVNALLACQGCIDYVTTLVGGFAIAHLNTCVAMQHNDFLSCYNVPPILLLQTIIQEPI